MSFDLAPDVFPAVLAGISFKRDRIRRTRRHNTEPTQGPAWLSNDALCALLERSAAGDVEAFMRFYDATSSLAWRLELRRTRSTAAAEEATCRRFVSAWTHSGQQASSGLSPRAWLLSLPEAEAAA